LGGGGVKGNHVACDQKISKFFVSHVEESTAGHKLGRGITKGDMVGPGGTWKQTKGLSVFQVLLKLMLTYGKEEPDDSQTIIDEWGGVWRLTAR
jgi:hypothetical protein